MDKICIEKSYSKLTLLKGYLIQMSKIDQNENIDVIKLTKIDQIDQFRSEIPRTLTNIDIL